jgi:hypothetical protein
MGQADQLALSAVEQPAPPAVEQAEQPVSPAVKQWE